MKNKITLLLLVIIITQSQLIAQYNLISGHIITNSQDTIKGYLRNDIDAKLRKSIEFHHDLSEEDYMIYTPSQISGFSFSNGRNFKAIQLKNDTVSEFGKRIVTGKINMYLVRKKGSDKNKIFLLRSDTSLSVTLTHPIKKTIKKKGKTYSYKDRKYLGLLSYITDSHKTKKTLNSVKYREKDISKYIMYYNSEFEKKYPSNIYIEDSKITYDIAVGLPFKTVTERTLFRFSAYRNNTRTEISLNFSTIMGISYRYWGDNKKPELFTHQNSVHPYRGHFLSIIPFGLSYQGNPRKIIPYGYAGIGLGIDLMNSYIIRNYEIKGTKNDFYFIPVLNCAVGLKFKLKSNYIFAEITPSADDGFYINLGYSF